MIVEFNYIGAKVTIQCNPDKKIKNIYESYANKIEMDINSLYFSYGGKAGDDFNKELILEEMINSEYKTRNKMNILVFKNESINENQKIKSKITICPICGESIINCKVKLLQCLNNHTKDNILLDEFEESQKIDNSQMWNM